LLPIFAPQPRGEHPSSSSGSACFSTADSAGNYTTSVDATHVHAADATPQELADILIDLLVKRYPQTRAFAALLDSRTDWTEVRKQLRTQTLAGIKTALTTCAPDLDDKEAEDVAAVVLSNMKTMVGMAKKDVPTTPGAPDQLRLMNRLYLAAVLRPGRLTAQ
jgi:hypothetical protein